MVIRFKNKNTGRICNEEDFARKKLTSDKTVLERLKILMLRLDAIPKFTAFLNSPLKEKYRVHEMHGGKRGIYSLSIDIHYRMELVIEVKNISEDEICILEVTNHYGD